VIPHRANTPEQKAEVLRRIADHWSRNPELRLMQLITASLQQQTDSNDGFYVEDYELLDHLDKTFSPVADGFYDLSDTDAKSE